MEQFSEKNIIKDSGVKRTIEDRQWAFCIEKAEKLCTAIHRVSDFMSDNEPLRLELRSQAISILKDISVFQGHAGIFSSLDMKSISQGFNYMLALCQVASASGQYSVMNFEILRKEYVLFRDYLEEAVAKQQRLLSGALISLTSPVINEDRDLDQNILGKAGGEEYKGHNSIMSDRMSYGKGGYDSLRQSINIAGHGSAFSFKRDGLNNKNKSAGLSISNNRQSLIKQFLLKKGTSSITDISRSIPDCVEKTVQRELNKMIELGLVRREGERRWSRYSII